MSVSDEHGVFVRIDLHHSNPVGCDSFVDCSNIGLGFIARFKALCVQRLVRNAK